MAYSTRGVWSEAEHDRFLKAMQLFPNGPWRAVAEHVGTRSVRQVQTHAQKYHEKVARRLRGLRKDRKRLQRPEHRIDDEMLEICKALQQDGAAGTNGASAAGSTKPKDATTGTPYHRRSRSMMEWKDLKQVQANLVATANAQALSELTEVEDEDATFAAPVPPTPPLSECLDFLIDLFNEPRMGASTGMTPRREPLEIDDQSLDHLQLATARSPSSSWARARHMRQASM